MSDFEKIKLLWKQQLCSIQKAQVTGLKTRGCKINNSSVHGKQTFNLNKKQTHFYDNNSDRLKRRELVLNDSEKSALKIYLNDLEKKRENPDSLSDIDVYGSEIPEKVDHNNKELICADMRKGRMESERIADAVNLQESKTDLFTKNVATRSRIPKAHFSDIRKLCEPQVAKSSVEKHDENRDSESKTFQENKRALFKNCTNTGISRISCTPEVQSSDNAKLSELGVDNKAEDKIEKRKMDLDRQQSRRKLKFFQHALDIQNQREEAIKEKLYDELLRLVHRYDKSNEISRKIER